MENIIKVRIADLESNPVNRKIYPSTHSIQSLQQSIKEIGQATPITMTTKKKIISGHRRYDAMNNLGMEYIFAIEKEYATEEDEIIELIASNKQRVKSTIEIFNEIKYYKETWGRKKGQRTDLEEGAIKGSTKELIAEELNISTGNIQKYNVIAAMDESLFNLIDAGEETINSAYKKALAIRKQSEVPNTGAISDAAIPIPNIEKVKQPKIKINQLSEEDLNRLLNRLEEMEPTLCKCPHCSSIVDVIELLKNHKI